jgi:hypothetical protein
MGMIVTFERYQIHVTNGTFSGLRQFDLRVHGTGPKLLISGFLIFLSGVDMIGGVRGIDYICLMWSGPKIAKQKGKDYYAHEWQRSKNP